MSPRYRQLEPEELEEEEILEEIDEKLYGAKGREGYERRQLQLVEDLRREETEDYERAVRSHLGKASVCKHKFVDLDGYCVNCMNWTGPDLLGGSR